MNTVEEIERAMERLAPEDFAEVAAWIQQRRQQGGKSRQGQERTTVEGKAYPESMPDSGQMILRDHSAFLNSYAPEDEGLYDDGPGR